jgi:hypothetical protein
VTARAVVPYLGASLDGFELGDGSDFEAWLAGRRAAGHELPLPPSVHDAVMARLSTLDEATRRLLEAASLLGTRFMAEDLVGTTALAAFELVAAVERACARHVLFREEPAGTLHFGHDLPTQTLTASVSPERRRPLHRRLAAVIDRRSGAPSRIAGHLEQAGLPARALRRLAELGGLETMTLSEAVGTCVVTPNRRPCSPQATRPGHWPSWPTPASRAPKSRRPCTGPPARRRKRLSARCSQRPSGPWRLCWPTMAGSPHRRHSSCGVHGPARWPRAQPAA